MSSASRLCFAALALLVHTGAGAGTGNRAAVHGDAQCSMPASLDGRTLANQTDPMYQPDNPHAGRLVMVTFSVDTYTLRVAASGLQVQGRYDYRLLERHVAEVRMTEAFPGGASQYRLLMTCQNEHGGRFVFTQERGPVPPPQRQNGGTWSLLR